MCKRCYRKSFKIEQPMANVSNWVKLIRFNNLIINAFVQFFYFIILLKEHPELSFYPTFLIMIFSFFIGASTYIFNDIVDLDIDKINKPESFIIENQLSLKASKWGLFVFFFVGFLISIYCTFYFNLIFWAANYLILSGLSSYYSIIFKRIFLIGNLIVAFFCSYSILLIQFVNVGFDFSSINLNSNLGFLLLFSFLITLIREIVKDVEDIEGDKLLGLKTLPIVNGDKMTKLFLKALLIISIIGLSFYFSNNWIFNVLNCVLIAIYMYLLLELTKAEDKKNYHRISSILKYSMVIGLICAYWLD